MMPTAGPGTPHTDDFGFRQDLMTFMQSCFPAARGSDAMHIFILKPVLALYAPAVEALLS